MVVRRASQVHQMPHARRPQSGPVVSTTVQNTTPTSAPGQSPRIGDLRPVRTAAPPGQVTDRTQQADGEEQKRHRSRRHVVVDDAEDITLHGIIRRDVDSLIEAPDHEGYNDRSKRPMRSFLMRGILLSVVYDGPGCPVSTQRLDDRFKSPRYVQANRSGPSATRHAAPRRTAPGSRW